MHGVREAARKDSTLTFTALWHHVNEDCPAEAFFNLKETAAVGVDGGTWQDCAQNLEANIADLHALRRRSQRGRSGWTWERMQRLVRRHLPRPRSVHPYPDQRFRVRLEARTV